MTTILPALGAPILADLSAQIDRDGLDQSLAENLGDNVTTNVDGFAHIMDGDWTAFDPMIESSVESEYHILPSPRHQTLEGEHEPAALRGLSTAAPSRDEENGADNVEPTHRLDGDDDDLPRRELRPQEREKRSFATTWIDNDETGNYDPVEEEREARRKRAKLKAATHQRLHRDLVEPASDDDVSDLTDETSEPAKLLASLTFTSQTGKIAFSDLLTELAVQQTSDTVGYRLRKRSKLVATYPGSTQEAIDGISTEIDLTAKPFARGCWGCTSTGICSLLHDESQWPCRTCSEDKLDCELIIPPVCKRGCETCRRRKIGCSYKYTRNHGAACEQCQRIGQKCIAGPVKEFIKPRISYDRNWEADPRPKRRVGKQKELEDCLECVGARRPCSYPVGNHGSPCEECTNRGMPCTITSNAPAESASPDDRAASADNSASIDGKADDDGNEKITSSDGALTVATPRSVDQASLPTRTAAAAAEHRLESPKSTLRKIYTSFSHPITFNCDLEGEQDLSCHFCTEPALPKLGFGPVHAEVIDWSDGRGFVEVSGGHNKVNQIEKTRLCYSCTSSRLEIATCYRHKLGKLALQEPGQTVDIEAQSCHVCDGYATFACVTSDGDTTGCGLKLCRPCAVTLSSEFSGYLGRMLGTLAHAPEDPNPRTLRADGEFLRHDGHMARYLKSLET